MPENSHPTPSIGQIDLDFVEREATPRLFMKISIQLHLAVLSLLNTVRIFETFGVERARSTVHNWVHRADLQPESGRSPDHVAVDETVIRLNDEQYWLYTAVDPESNDLLHTTFEPTRNKFVASTFSTECRENNDVDAAVFLVDGDKSLNDACQRHGLDLRYERHGNRNSIERVFQEVKQRTSSLSNCFSNTQPETTDQWLRSFVFAWNQLI
ncbi:IS6 family transposase [Halomontanus rarus]|uniref:IS6 family transposase n=1 Tax=Halomontanus rarus TaxID=3034020 RepID=UPI00293BAC58|nr:IS6 family transposase [Halovivax sp. KZCA124]